jgi:hypothetical protein
LILVGDADGPVGGRPPAAPAAAGASRQAAAAIRAARFTGR